MKPPPSTAIHSVFVVSNDTRRAAEVESMLAGPYRTQVFPDADAALSLMTLAPPDVVLVEAAAPPKGGVERLIAGAETLGDRRPSFVVAAAKGEGFPVAPSAVSVSLRLLRRPFEKSVLLNTLSDLIGERAQRRWESLPEVPRAALKLTVEEYQRVADAIGRGEPVSCRETADSCKPLLHAVTDGHHHSMLKAVQSHNNYTYVHSTRVATLLTLFGHGIGMDEEQLLTLSAAGLLHDVGKIVVPLEILDKPGKLTDEEWVVMRNHVVESANILGHSDDLTRGTRIIAEQHHEKLDGSGYPKGLSGKALNDLARMAAICDIFGALTDPRSYKPAMPAEKAFAILDSMEKELDQHLVGLFKDIFVPGSEMDGNPAAT